MSTKSAKQKILKDKSDIEDYVEEERYVNTYCNFCSEEISDSTSTDDETAFKDKQTFVQRLYVAGWRQIDSEKYDMVGLACPKCVKKKDANR
jgi:hypothetical protein